MKCVRGLLLSLCFVSAGPIGAGSCQKCYYQRAALFMNCMVSRNYFISYKDRCVGLHKQLQVLSRIHKLADRVIAERPKGRKILTFYADTEKPEERLPYDMCDACFNDIKTLAVFCHSKEKAKIKDCKTVIRVGRGIHQVIALHPYVLAENLDFVKK